MSGRLILTAASPVLAILASLLYVPSAVQTPCSCTPDSAEQHYDCCDTTGYGISISTPTQSPRCFDFLDCNDPPVPCKWTMSMWITTATHHDFEELHNQVPVSGATDARGLSWSSHPVELDCEGTATEIITCDGQACLEADFACWDCSH